MRPVDVANTTEIPAGTLKRVSIDGTKVLLANLDGQFYAIADRCPHMGGSLSEGKREGNLIVCPNHGAAFDLTTGQNVRPARVLFLSRKPADATTYRVEVKGTRILVWFE